MKLTISLLLFAVLAATAGSSYSQTARFNLKMKDATMIDVFRQIERTSDFGFFFKNNELDLNQRISIDLKDATIDEILKKILTDNYSYRIIDKNIIVTRNDVNNTDQQQKSVSGRVTDSSGSPIPGVSVVVKGTSNGIITDTDGNYSLSKVPDKATLAFSFIGMKTKEVLVGNQTSINVIMEVDAIGIKEVVAIGYGISQKKDITGSVVKVTADEIVDRPAFNLGSALQGKISGVDVFMEGGGSPGLDPVIRIRGINSLNSDLNPLWVVDGIIGVSNVLSTLNPGDIESIDVLKDASATAIYGSRGANGVILVTTKKGKVGKVQIEYNRYTSISILTRHFPALNADEDMYVYSQAFANADKYGNINRSQDFRAGYATGKTFSDLGYLFKQVPAGSYIVPLIGADGNSYAPRFDTNWESEAYQPAWSNNDEISIRGGSELATFGFSFRTGKENGLLVEDSFFNRISAKADAKVKLFEWLDFSTMLLFSKTRKASVADNMWIGRQTVESWSILPSSKYPDNSDIYGDHAGKWSTNSDFIGENWISGTNFLLAENDRFDYNNQTTGNVALTAKISPHITFDTNFGFDMNNPKMTAYNGRMYVYTGSASISTNQNFSWQNEYYVNYINSFNDKHSIKVTLGMSWSESTGEYFGGSNSQFFDNFYQWHNIGVGNQTRPVPSSSDWRSSLNSYFARVNYNLMDKYLLTLTGRCDGSSKFGSNNKYGFFPSGGLAWRVNEEGFMKDSEIISNLKLRGSIGQTGNQGINPYESQQFLSIASIVIGSGVNPGLYPSTVGNGDLKWETTTQADIGLDLGLWGNTVDIEADYYYKKTSDMLLNVNTPYSTSVGSVFRNYGSVENQGVDFSLHTYNIRNSNFTWNTRVVFNANKNKILKLGPTGADIYNNVSAGQGTWVLREGEPVGSYFGLVRLGTYSTEEASLAAQYGMLPGDLKFEDRNGDGKINFLEDGTIIGHSFPKWTGSINNTFQYKNFDASLDIRIVYGMDKCLVLESGEDRQIWANGRQTILDAWRPDHQNSMIAQVRPAPAGAYYQSVGDSHGIEDASNIRGQNLTIGYTLPKNLIRHISRMRVYLAANNFFLLTKTSSYDPEGSSYDRENPLKLNEDKYMYPRPAIFSIGLNVNL